MNDPINREVFDHLVRLASLELGPEESEYLRQQLNHQLKAIRELESIPLDPRTPLAAHGVPYTPQISPSLRGDTWQPSTEAPDIMRQVPKEDGGYIVVPEIPHTDLE
jgi:aspartyl/glutamyl-tRNA(Asn/Gln) amidotransferase C subunit